jgi:hypothetical protein
VRTLLADSSLEELRDYLSGLEEVKRTLELARDQGMLSHREADMALSKWLTGQ